MWRWQLRTIAKGWWRWTRLTEAEQKRDYYPYERIHGLVDRRPDLLPALFRALADTAPPAVAGGAAGLSFAGTDLFEDAFTTHGARAGDLLVASGLPPARLLEIFSGVWPSILAEVPAVRSRSAGLSADAIAWLLDLDADGRPDRL